MAKKRPGVPVKRIAELGVVTAAITVIYFFTAPFIDNLIPYIGCVIRTIAIGVFLTGIRHYSGWELLLMSGVSSLLYFFMLPCFNTALGIPVAIVFMAVFLALRRYVQPWIAIAIGSLFGYAMMVLMLFIWEPSKFVDKFVTALMWSPLLVIVVALLAWWRQGRTNQIGCSGCTASCDVDIFRE